MVSGRSLVLSPGASATEGGHPSALSYRGVREFVNCLASEQPGETSSGESADLARQAASRGDVRIALWLAGGLAAIAAAALAFGRGATPAIPGFLPILTTITVVMEFITAYVFLGYFSTTRVRSALFLGASYLFVGLISITTLLTFPGALTEGGMFGADGQTVAYLWLCSHAGFPALVWVSTLFSSRRSVPEFGRRQTVFAALAVIAGCTLSGMLLPLVLIHLGHALPILSSGGWFSGAVRWSALPAICAVDALVIARLVFGEKRPNVTNLWLGVALFALLLDSVISLSGVGESLAWYAGKLFGAISASIVLVGYIREILKFNATLTHVNDELRNVNEEQRRRTHERLVFLAYHDELTGLHNRCRWQELLEICVERANGAADRSGRFGVLFIDLDNFKDVNDALGHARGDEVLVEAGRRLRGVLRSEDLIGRLGGDEFAVLLPELRRAGEADEIADRLLKAMRRPFVLNDRSFTLGASFGIAQYPEHGTTAEALLHHSDVALYCAKRDGGNCRRHYTDAMGHERDERRDLRLALARAIEGREFTMHYQPMLDLRSGRIEGAEALIRWQDPIKGMIAPRTFVRVAEESGLMKTIGRWTLEATISQLRQWNSERRRVRISANVSVSQLQDPYFFEHLRETLRYHAVSPTQIRLEVTESAAMADLSAATELLSRCRALGIEIMLDDFGTHYSSLTYLKQLPIDTIKIDQSFVRDLPSNEQDAAIVRGVISLGHDLSRNIIAEGVENEAQLNWLRHAACDGAQGYLIERPMPPTQYGLWSDSRELAWAKTG
jgi:diguanylate cyclase (GGDEF)-like protein